MSNISPRLGLPYLLPAQAQKHVTHNMALQMLDILTQLSLASLEAETPPASPAIGEIHALGAAPEGAWSGRAGQLAFWDGGSWQFVTPGDGWRATDTGSGRVLIHKDGGWQDVLADLDNLDGVGIATTADDQNRLAVAAPASLFSHAGAGHQMKLNKAGPGETASLLFQSGWNGHAELGLVGDLALALKLSPDGQSWQEVLRADPAAATLSLGPAGQSRLRLHDDRLELDVPLTGPAVQADLLDTTAGRLLATGAFGLGATDLSTLRQNDGEIALPSGFYAGNGGTADAGTYPTPGCRYAPFLTMNRRISDGVYLIRRVFFDDNVPIVRSSSDTGISWDTPNTLYGTSNVLGTVSQSGGVPTGAVIERGSNANGEYVRFADGTQICTIDAAAGVDVNTASGSIYRSTTEGTWTFPAGFMGTAGLVVSGSAQSGAGTERFCNAFPSTASTAKYLHYSGVQSATTVITRLIATGRWF